MPHNVAFAIDLFEEEGATRTIPAAETFGSSPKNVMAAQLTDSEDIASAGRFASPVHRPVTRAQTLTCPGIAPKLEAASRKGRRGLADMHDGWREEAERVPYLKLIVPDASFTRELRQ